MRHWFPHKKQELEQIERSETERLLEQAEDFAYKMAKRKRELERKDADD